MKQIQKTLSGLLNMLILSCLVTCQPVSGPKSQNRTEIDEIAKSIQQEAIRVHLLFLADDALEGRGTGTRGHELAAGYIQSLLMASGLSGGAENGSYFQKVPFIHTTVDPSATTMEISKTKPLEYARDFILYDTHNNTEGSISAPMVFVGYGVTAPEFNYDDYTGFDVAGKIAVFMDFEAPPSFPPTIRAYYADHDVKLANAAKHGAIGAIYVRSPESELRFPWKFILREVQIGWNSIRWSDENGKSGILNDQIKIMGMMNRSGGEALFSGEKRELTGIFEDISNGSLKGFGLNKTVTVQYKAHHEQIESENIIAKIEGSDPKLKNEWVVFTTHPDHLGIGPVIDGDSIYNGALDNASGCAVLLEVARAYSNLKERPKRSILFVFVTGEEAGLQGSDYFVHYPVVPVDQIVANLNIDGGISPIPLNDIVVRGTDHSSLATNVQDAAGRLGIKLSPDPFPEEGFFVRSDQFSFIKKGIPSLFLMNVGVETQISGVDATNVFKNWMTKIYHSPKDDLNQPLDYEGSAKFTQFLFGLGYSVAIQPDKPQWNENDFFKNKFTGTVHNE